jgi:hypothetical protein
MSDPVLRQVSQQPVRPFVLPPPPPTILEPIPTWVWSCSAALVVGLVVGSFVLIRWVRKQSQIADAAVASLHRKMTAADDAGIFTDADPTYREAVTAQTSMATFDNVRNRLGAPHASRKLNSNSTSNDSMGDFLTLQYLTVFDKGSGKEVICFHKLNGVWKLAAYNVESPLLQGNRPARTRPNSHP